jgi:nitrite reductase (NADH) small subunit
MTTVVTKSDQANWVDVCAAADLVPDRGVAALVVGEPVAVFLLGDGQIFALSNRDPWSGANVLSRGIVGSIGDRLVLASPMYKQHLDLATGEGVEHRDVRVATWPARVSGRRVQIATTMERG